MTTSPNLPTKPNIRDTVGLEIVTEQHGETTMTINYITQDMTLIEFAAILEGIGDTVPDEGEFNNLDTYEAELSVARRNLEAAKALTVEQDGDEVAALQEAASQQRAERVDHAKAILRENERMLAEVTAWEPITDAQRDTKDEMVVELAVSIHKLRKVASGEWLMDTYIPTPEEYIEREIHKAQWEFDMAKGGLERATRRQKEANEWLGDMRKSLGDAR